MMAQPKTSPLQLAARAAALAVQRSRREAEDRALAQDVMAALREGDLAALATALRRARGAAGALHRAPEPFLQQALLGGHHEAIPLLVEAGANPDGLDHQGRPLLRLALERGPLASVAALVAAGARWEQPGPDGLHTLEAALLALQEAEALAMLCRPPSRLEDFRSRHGGSALHLAASGGLLAVARRLLDLGHPLDGWREDGDTPLHRAVIFAEPDLQALLLEAGASLPPGLAKDAFLSAAYWGALPIIEAGAAQGRSLVDPALGLAAGRGGSLEVLAWLEARGVLRILAPHVQAGADQEQRTEALAWLEARPPVP